MSSEPVTPDAESMIESGDPLADLPDPGGLADPQLLSDPDYDEPGDFDELAGDHPYPRSDPEFGDDEPVLLVWPQPEFAEVDLRWPELLEPIRADSWDDYRRHYQALITRLTSRGRPLSMVSGTADGFAEWLVERGADPFRVNLGALVDEYGRFLTEQGTVVELPPGEADPCWCGSGSAYRACCLPLVSA